MRSGGYVTGGGFLPNEAGGFAGRSSGGYGGGYGMYGGQNFQPNPSFWQSLPSYVHEASQVLSQVPRFATEASQAWNAISSWF